MDENNNLNKKYQKIEDSQNPTAESAKDTAKKPKKERAPKEKKAKEPKPPKEKKKKEPKEKKVKEPKPPKEKKSRLKNREEAEMKVFPNLETDVQSDTQNEIASENTDSSISVTEFVDELFSEREMQYESDSQEEFSDDYLGEPSNKTVGGNSRVEEEEIIILNSDIGKKKKKVKEPKEKKEKEPKPQKENKIKEPKPPKEKKVKEKKPKEPKPKEPMNAKDFATIGIAVIALCLVACLVGFKVLSGRGTNPVGPESTTTENKLSSIQVARNGVLYNLVQSDIPDVFFGFSTDYKLQYYQYRDNKMVPVQSTGKVTANVDMGNQTLPVTIEYVQLGGEVFGIGLFKSDENSQVYFYDMVVFKLTNLPDAYASEGKALLLASTGNSALTGNDILWNESFTIDLKSGETSRFLKIINRTIDMTGAGVKDFCMLSKEGYNAASQIIPFISSREYQSGSGKQDIFIKDGSKESLFASDVYGKFLISDGKSVIYMKKTTTGFDVIRKTGDSEETVRSFYGFMNSEYLNSGEYILGKNDGKLYNLKTGEEKTLVGYRMSPEMMKISPDGRYVVMLGTVQSIMDYQVHIFDLQTGEYMKYVDKNYSSHSNLTFINKTTAVYLVLDPNQGYEYVVLDVTKIS